MWILKQQWRVINLSGHVEAIHELFFYLCSQCDYTKTSKASLKIHVESILEGDNHAINVIIEQNQKTGSR